MEVHFILSSYVCCGQRTFIWASSEEEGWVGTNKGLAGHSTARQDTAEETKGYEINFGPFFPLSLYLLLLLSLAVNFKVRMTAPHQFFALSRWSAFHGCIMSHMQGF